MKFNPAELLGGGYNGLFGEVVDEDCYRLREVRFQPDLVFDIGANVGIFSRYARLRFPSAVIIAVEPHPPNIEAFRLFPADKDILLMEAALGSGGPLYRSTGAPNGAGEVYASAGLGYHQADLDLAVLTSPSLEVANILSFSLADILALHWDPGRKTVVKVDCEGAENHIWGDEISMGFLSHMDYIAMELHFFGHTPLDVKEVTRVTEEGLKRLEATHDCKRQGAYFWAHKKP